MKNISDEDIARRVQQGDINAFSLLVQRYEAKITRYGRKFLAHPDDIKDIVQEIFTKTFVNIRSFDAKRKFSPWIYRIAHNEFVNALKKKKTDKLALVDFDVFFPHPAAKEAADSDVDRADLRRMLDECMEKLPMKYREPLILYYFEEMGYREIADVMHLPVSTVGVRLQRGKALLKKIVENNRRARSER